MSRMGRKPISVPGNVKVSIQGSTVSVEGPKGKLAYTHRAEVTVSFDAEAKEVTVGRRDDSREAKSMHGLTRALVANMVEGVANGYTKTMEIYGTGYNVKQEGQQVAINVGFANTVKLDIPAGVTLQIQTPQSRSDTMPAVFSISGPDKQVVGELASRIKRIKKPEPYKGKGIRFQGERIRRKAGKAFGAAK